jgi:hypothetical protein
VLDIGSHVGAAVVYVKATLDGAEIEIRPRRADWTGTHTAVRRRPPLDPDSPPVFAALFDRLAAGPYVLRVRGQLGALVHPIEVVGGQVVATELPD